VDLLPDAEQEQIAAAARQLLSSAQRDRSRGGDDTGPVTDPRLWRRAAAQGWFGLSLPAEVGGAGLGLAEQTLICREIGRTVTPGPFASTALAGHVAVAAGDLDLARRIIDGSVPTGLAELVNGEQHDGTAIWRTFDAADAAAYVCVTSDWSFIVPAADARVIRTRACLDPASRWAELEIAARPSTTVSTAALDATRYGRILAAAMLAGIAEGAAAASGEYARTRQQFGVPIGTFQAVKHRCAVQLVRAEAAASLVSLAALTDARDDASAVLVSSASLLSAKYAIANAADNIQNHGALGFTSEHSAHLYLKRAHVLSMWLSTPLDLTRALTSSAG
jgi:alkylation response protein AidB-like acyl-CoA dehydrogenase